MEATTLIIIVSPILPIFIIMHQALCCELWTWWKKQYGICFHKIYRLVGAETLVKYEEPQKQIVKLPLWLVLTMRYAMCGA